MKLNVSVEKPDEKTRILSVQGEIDMNTSPELRRVLASEQEARPAIVIIDLSGVEYIDSSGIATLIEGLQRSKKSQTVLRLAGLTSMVRDVFELARLQDVFEIFNSRQEALDAT